MTHFHVLCISDYLTLFCSVSMHKPSIPFIYCLLITHICKIITSVATWALITTIYLPILATILKLTNPGSPGRQTLGRPAGKSQDWAEVERFTLSVSSAIPENSGLNERVQANGAPVFISLCSGGHSVAKSHISPASSSPPL